MENYKLGFKTFVFTLIITILFTSCSENAKNNFYFALDMAGLLNPREPRISLSFDNQNIEDPFSFSDYCEEEYDSIFIVYSYFNTERDEFLNLKMSNILRRKCDNNTMFDSFSTLLFIKNGKVEAYSEIQCVDADFDSREVEKHYIFPIDQKFIMDKERKIHIYNE